MWFNEYIKPTVILKVLSDPEKHWSRNRVSFAYLSDGVDESVINFHHNDAPICLRIDDLSLDDTLYSFPQIVDPEPSQSLEGSSAVRFRNAEMMYWFITGKKLEIIPDSTIRRYQGLGVDNVNDAVPMMRWIEYCRAVRDLISGLTAVDRSIDIYERFALNLRRIERNGLWSINKMEYTQYNPYTLTGRPSNHFGGINYAALPNDQRVKYSTRYRDGFLIDVDLSGFHLQLIYSLLGLEFPSNVYNSLAQYYPQGVDAKTYTFKQIYGGIDPALLDKSPFIEIDQAADTLFNAYLSGDLTTLLHGRKFTLPDRLTKWKLFSYCLQSLETEHNMELIDRCVAEGLNLVLYTYDSFLFDIDSTDVPRSIQKIKDIFAQLRYKVKIGKNYGQMRTILI